jgi:uncharacterized Zn-binding protein involved in type VI secretion
MGQPAARLSDMHVCPMVTPGLPPVPHAGGPINPPCEPQVQTGFLAQARVSDMATCVGPLDVIAQGAATVLVRGLPAARMGDSCVHGGAVVVGFPTVLIGGPTFSARPVKRHFNVLTWSWEWDYGSAITVTEDPNDPTYQSRALAALIRLDTTPTGQAMFNAIEASGNHVTVVPFVPTPASGPFNASCTPDNDTDARTPGTGTDSTVAWDPDVHGFGPPGTTPNSSQPGSDIILGHEMIHAAHNATGTKGNGPINAANSNVSEERNTVGLPASTYNDPAGRNGPPANGTPLPDTTGGPYTENGLRNDYRNQGIPSPVTGAPPVPRPSYGAPTPTDGPGAPF